MNDWQPDTKEQAYLRLVMSMSLDCLMCKGTSTAATYTKNLRMIADQINEYNQPKEGNKPIHPTEKSG